MAHEIETMAFANEVPWHGLGNKINPNTTVEKMLTAAGLDWEVELKPCYANIGTEAKPKLIDIDRKALIRSTDQKLLTVTGNNWHPLQNRDTLAFFRDYTKEGGATLETAGSLRGGKVIWALANLHTNFTIGKGDAVKGYLLLISEHSVGTSIRGYVTSVRVVCANTMASAEHSAKQGFFKQHHMRDFDPKEAKKDIGLMQKQFEGFKLDAKTLSNLEMSELDSVRFLARFFQPAPEEIKDDLANDTNKREVNKWIEQLLASPNEQSKNMAAVLDSLHNAPGAQPGTGWGVLNAVTHWADHKAGREADARLFNSWLGDRSRLKREVNSALLAMAS